MDQLTNTGNRRTSLDSEKRQKSKIGFLKYPEIQDWILKSKSEFCVSLLNRLIQRHSVHGTAKEPILDFLKETHPQFKNNSLGFTTDQGIIHYMAWGPNDFSPFGVGENPIRIVLLCS